MSVADKGIKQTAASKKALETAKSFGLTLTSGYRSPEHNASVGGSATSDHVKGQAYDFSGSRANMLNFAAWANRSGMYKQVIFDNKDYRTGAYISGHQDHVHVAWSAAGVGSLPVEKGDSGYIVKTIQVLLKWLGLYKGEIDGKFGDNTEAAVKNYQKSKGLAVDGEAGKATLSALFGANAFFIQ